METNSKNYLNSNASKTSQFMFTLSKLQLLNDQLYKESGAMQHHLNQAIDHRDNLQKIKSDKMRQINKLLSELKKRFSGNLDHQVNIKKRSINFIEKLEAQIMQQINLYVPCYEINYVINEPKLPPNLEQKQSELNERVTRLRAVRDDEMRTLKIKISLAEIELRELRNRSRKV